MKITKVDHVRSGVSQQTSGCGGMLYKQPRTKYEGSNQLQGHIVELNKRAKALYQVFNVPKDKNKNQSVQSMNSFMKTILSQMDKNASNDVIINSIEKEQTDCNIHGKSIQIIVDQYLRESLRKYVKVEGEKKQISEIICNLLRVKFDRNASWRELSRAEVEALLNVLREDYLKTEQVRNIALSIESKGTPVQIREIDGEKRLVLSSALNKKKEHTFEFLKEYAKADQEDQRKLLRHIRFLILLFFYGPDKISEDNEEITAWSFGNVIQDSNELFSESAFMLLQDKEYVKQQFDASKRAKEAEIIKENKAKLRILNDRIKEEINNHIVQHYQQACACVKEKDIPWIRYISDHTMGVFANKNQISPDKLSLSYLCKNTWNVWISYIAMKYIDMGKGVYHFAMSEATKVGKEKNVILGKVNSEFAEGISSFDYERIKAEDELHRSMSGYITFAANNFSKAVCRDEKCEDILNAKWEDVVFYDDAKERLLRYFGGASNWKDTILEVIDAEDLADCFKINLNIARNANFHFAGSLPYNQSQDEILEELISREVDGVGKYYRKIFYANNVTKFYSNEDITKLMDHLYQGVKEYQAQIPSFNKVISKTYLPDLIFQYIKGNNRTKISKPETMIVFSGAFYFVLKEIYYNNFLQDAQLKERFCKAVEKAKDAKKKDEPYVNFMSRFRALEEMNLTFGEICQQMMTDYEQQNCQIKKKASAVASPKEGGSPKRIEDNRQKYKHFRTLLYIGLREAFMDYLKEDKNKEWYAFLRQPQEREQPEEEGFVNGWKTNRYDDRKEMILSNSLVGAWYVTAHFINQRQLNHLIGDIKNYIQFVQDIDRRAKSTGNRTSGETKAHVEESMKILNVLEFAKYFCAQTTNLVQDYYQDENVFAEHIGKYVEFNRKNVEAAQALQAFCNSECRVGKNKRKIGIYYDGMNPIMNRNVTLAAMYGNERLLAETMIPVTEKEIQQYYNLMEELEPVLKNGSVCKTEEQQQKLRHFQNLKNRIELADVLTLSELVNDFLSQLISWAYIRERDMMYLQLGLYYIKLYFTDTISKDSYLRRLDLEREAQIEDGAVLYQIAAMYSYDYPLYIREQDSNLASDKILNCSIGKKFAHFEKEYCKDDGRVIENGLCLFENLNDHKRLTEFRNYLDHFKYYAKQDQSILDMYSTVYDSFFSYDIKLKKSVSYIITNILLSYFVNAKLSFALCGTEEYKKGDKKYKRRAAHISLEHSGVQSDYFTYKLREIVKEKNGVEKVENDASRCKTVSVAARNQIFIDEVIHILEYKKVQIK